MQNNLIVDGPFQIRHLRLDANYPQLSVIRMTSNRIFSFNKSVADPFINPAILDLMRHINTVDYGSNM